MAEMPVRPVITLLTDFGHRDGFVGIMKGVILNIAPETHIVDISHEIPPHHVPSAAFVLGQAYSYFPAGTLHVVVVDPEVGSSRKILYVEAGGYRFLVPDNNVLQFVLSRTPAQRVISVTNTEFFLPRQSATFHGRDIFAPVAGHLVRGLDPTRLGEEIHDYRYWPPPEPRQEDDFLVAEIIYIDHFGNLITNVREEKFHQLLAGGQGFRIRIAGKEIKELSESFYAQKHGELLAYMDSSQYLAIALNGESAAEKMGISIGDRLEIELVPSTELHT